MRYILILALAGVLSGCRKAPPTLAHGHPVSHWVEALHDPDAAARKKAVSVLGNVGPADAAAIPALIRAVKDPEVAVRDEAILALLKIGPVAREAIPTLIEAQQDEDPTVRSHAAKAVARIQGGG
jgi:HEAT repeat protein